VALFVWWTANRVYDIGGDVRAPEAIVSVKPEYTRAAMAAKLQGTVRVGCVITTKGQCTDLEVRRSLDSRLGLDDAALTALRQWRFRPAIRQGQPVAVRVQVDMAFSLRR
jgi:TonB family protein